MPGQLGPMSRVFLAVHRPLHLDHVVDGNAFGDADDEVQSGVHALENRIRGKGWGHKDGRGGRAGGLHGLGDRIKYGDFVSNSCPPLPGVTPATICDAVGQAKLRVPRSKAAGDALDEDLGIRLDKNRHGEVVLKIGLRP